jgi:hypothetical protein
MGDASSQVADVLSATVAGPNEPFSMYGTDPSLSEIPEPVAIARLIQASGANRGMNNRYLFWWQSIFVLTRQADPVVQRNPFRQIRFYSGELDEIRCAYRLTTALPFQ